MKGLSQKTVLVTAGILLLSIASLEIADAAVSEKNDMQELENVRDLMKVMVSEKCAGEIRADSTQLPVMEINGQDYAGLLSFDDCSIELPVLSEADESGEGQGLRWISGNLHSKDMMLECLSVPGKYELLLQTEAEDTVSFMDMSGAVFVYTVSGVESVRENKADEIKADADLTIICRKYFSKVCMVYRCTLNEV